LMLLEGTRRGVGGVGGGARGLVREKIMGVPCGWYLVPSREMVRVGAEVHMHTPRRQSGFMQHLLKD